jgi:hypothetical protein
VTETPTKTEKNTKIEMTTSSSEVIAPLCARSGRCGREFARLLPGLDLGGLASYQDSTACDRR